MKAKGGLCGIYRTRLRASYSGGFRSVNGNPRNGGEKRGEECGFRGRDFVGMRLARMNTVDDTSSCITIHICMHACASFFFFFLSVHAQFYIIYISKIPLCV